ncbi:hypothetical protein [Pasteurella multocida]|uniref:hypothetical protein n=1 Tax=Pasteurella multocida TaxID=747 RepID=UPI0023011E41|nr:hypothetical protein [Pasteurella multocida]MDA5607743.1 hypothetical protein [Pasteurella multocida subsp. multocida]MDA5615288.1 hypothetical protein [Pasteurella multocida]MDA5625325.1 hypothetical protein [Pasteurella multocida]
MKTETIKEALQMIKDKVPYETVQNATGISIEKICVPVTGVSEDDHKQIYRIAHDYLYKFDGKIHLAPNDPLYGKLKK